MNLSHIVVLECSSLQIQPLKLCYQLEIFPCITSIASPTIELYGYALYTHTLYSHKM